MCPSDAQLTAGGATSGSVASDGPARESAPRDASTRASATRDSDTHQRDTDALAQRDAIRARRVRPSELLESMIARADRLDGVVNAIVARDVVRARKDALVADERATRGESLPLLGVPMTVKDNFDVAGLSTTMGLPNLRKNLASTDATLCVDCARPARSSGPRRACRWPATTGSALAR